MYRPAKPLNGLLRMAVLAGVETAVRLHIRRGDDLDARDGSGATPLMLAAGRGKKGVLSLLLDAGADPSLVDPEGRDALAYARRSGNAECESVVLSALSRRERADVRAVSLQEPDVAANETSNRLLDEDEPCDEACWAPEADGPLPEGVSVSNGEHLAEAGISSVINASPEPFVSPSIVPGFVARAPGGLEPLSTPLDAPDDSYSDFWETEVESVAPQGNALVAEETKALNEAIGRHRAVDTDEDWSDVEVFLPERAAPILSDTDSNPLRRVLLRALAEGSVPALDVADACENADGSSNLEAEKLLAFVLGDLGADIDERDERGTEPWIGPESGADETILHESLDYLTDLSSSRNAPARYYVRAFRGKLLAADEEIALAKEMEDARDEALSALARWPAGIAMIFDLATKVLPGEEDDRGCFDSRDQDENTDVGADVPEREDGDKSQSGDGNPEGVSGRFAALAAEIRKAKDNHQAIETCLREAGFSRSFLARLAESGEGDEAARPFRASIRRQVGARERMVLSNLRLSFSIAKKYLHSGEPLDDLVQEGNIGLMKAVEKYEWRKGFRLSTYATWWIRQHITRYIADRGRTIRLPVHINEKLAKALRERDEFEAANHRPEKLAETAAGMGMAEGRLALLMAIADDTLSLDEADSDTGLPLIESLPGPEEDNPSSRGDASSLSSILGTMLSEFDERSAEVITLRFGLSGDDPMTLEEVGQHFGVTRERIRQVESKALRKLSQPSRLDKLACFVPGRWRESRQEAPSNTEPPVAFNPLPGYSARRSPSAWKSARLPEQATEQAAPNGAPEHDEEIGIAETGPTEPDATADAPSLIGVGETESDGVSEPESQSDTTEAWRQTAALDGARKAIAGPVPIALKTDGPPVVHAPAHVHEETWRDASRKQDLDAKRELHREAANRDVSQSTWIRGARLTFHRLFLRGGLQDVSDAAEWLESFDEAQGFFGDEAVELRGDCEFGLELSASGNEPPESLALFSEALTRISAAWTVEIDWLSTTSSRGCHTIARRFLAGVGAAVFDAPYYFASVDEAADAFLLQKGDADALARHAERFFESLESLRRLGNRAAFEDDARVLSLGWHLCLAENVVSVLWERRPVLAFWERARDVVGSAQDRSEMLDFGEQENILSLLGEVQDIGRSSDGTSTVAKPLTGARHEGEGSTAQNADAAASSMLFMAVAAGATKSVSVHIRRREAIDCPNTDGETPLMIAARENHPKICSMLLNAGADQKARDGSGRTALGIAMRCGCKEAQSVLLKAKNALADPPAQHRQSVSLKAAYANEARAEPDVAADDLSSISWESDDVLNAPEHDENVAASAIRFQQAVISHVPVDGDPEWSVDPMLLPKSSELPPWRAQKPARSLSPVGTADSIPMAKPGDGSLSSAPRNNSRNATVKNYSLPGSFLEAARRLRDDSVIAKSDLENSRRSPVGMVDPIPMSKPRDGRLSSAPSNKSMKATVPDYPLPASFLEAARRLRNDSVTAKSDLENSHFSPVGMDDSIPMCKPRDGRLSSAPSNKSWNATVPNYPAPASFLDAAQRLRDDSARSKSNLDKLLDEARNLGFKVDDKRAVSGSVEVWLPAVKTSDARSLARRLLKSGFKALSNTRFAK